MQKPCVAVILIFCFLVVLRAGAQTATDAQIIHFTSPHTSFPDTARANGHLYNGEMFTTAEHYMDSSVMLVIPPHLNAGRKVDLIFWFHGWHNSIDTAAIFYGLIKQFVASNRNAVLVLAEAAKNAPDSYGGKLERPGIFKALVGDVIAELKKKQAIPAKASAGNIVLAGHSGAYRVIANILKNGQEPVQEVFLFDALYAELDKYEPWVKEDKRHHFVHWFTNKGGGTDEMSDTMMKQLSAEYIKYSLVEESAVLPGIVKTSRVLFVHSLREHNVIINNPDDFKLLLENSFCLKKK